MDVYTIKKAYHWTDDSEIAITSNNLIYSELGPAHHGCQSRSLKNNELIRDKCRQVADLIREIDNLNKL